MTIHATTSFTRRDFLRLSGMTGAVLAGASALAGCSVATDDANSNGSSGNANSSASTADYKYGKIDIPGKDGALCGAPMYIALENGYFAQAGFDVTLISADAETRKIGLNNGTIPIVNGDFQFFPSIEQGVKTKVVDGLHNGCIKIIVLPDSPIQGVEDLRGKTIAVDEIGGTPHQVASVWLETNGIKAAGDDAEVTFLPYSDGNLEFEALQNGDVDVAAFWDPIGSVREKSGEARVLLDIAKDEPFAGRYCCFLYASTAWLEEDEQRAADLLAAYHKAQDWIANNAEEAARIISEKQYSSIEDQDLAVQLLTSYEYPTLEQRASGEHSVLDDVRYFSQQLVSIGYLTGDPDSFANDNTVELDVTELEG